MVLERVRSEEAPSAALHNALGCEPHRPTGPRTSTRATACALLSSRAPCFSIVSILTATSNPQHGKWTPRQCASSEENCHPLSKMSPPHRILYLITTCHYRCSAQARVRHCPA